VPAEKKPAKPRTKKPEQGAARAASAARTPAARTKSSPKTSAKRPPAPRAARKSAAGEGSARAQARPVLKSVILGALDDMKALDVKILDVRGLTDIADHMVIASGTSDRHVRSVAQRVVEKTKEAGFRPHGVEGLKDGDWVLVDLHEMIVHIMLPRVREFYGLEKLWDLTVKRTARA
jgi:ribosome-associated protein